jgi:hypothetical protein
MCDAVVSDNNRKNCFAHHEREVQLLAIRAQVAQTSSCWSRYRVIESLEVFYPPDHGKHVRNRPQKN